MSAVGASRAPRSHVDSRALAEALEAGELHVEYQPLFQLDGRRLVGLEALARWTLPDLGAVPPSLFVPLAEESGLIGDLGAWVLDAACRSTARWQREHPLPTPLRISVNLSARQLDGDVPSVVSDALHRSGLAPSSLCIELTETAVMTDVERGRTTLEQLRALGVDVAVDDFGTGYSSLAYLTQLPVSELKIDQAFVAGLPDDKGDRAICAASVALAHALGLSVTAEGVETQAQLDELVRLGVDRAQGFMLGRPVPPERIVGRLVEERSRRHPGATVGVGPAVSNGLVMVVDDAEDVRQLASVTLAAAGYEVVEAATGADALDVAAWTHPRAVLLDVSLPDMTGDRVCRALRSVAGCEDTVVVMVTTHGEAAMKVRSFEAGADDYIVKPFTPRDLASRVDRAVERGRADSS